MHILPSAEGLALTLGRQALLSPELWCLCRLYTGLPLSSRSISAGLTRQLADASETGALSHPSPAFVKDLDWHVKTQRIQQEKALVPDQFGLRTIC